MALRKMITDDTPIVVHVPRDEDRSEQRETERESHPGPRAPQDVAAILRCHERQQ